MTSRTAAHSDATKTFWGCDRPSKLPSGCHHDYHVCFYLAATARATCNHRRRLGQIFDKKVHSTSTKIFSKYFQFKKGVNHLLISLWCIDTINKRMQAGTTIIAYITCCSNKHPIKKFGQKKTFIDVFTACPPRHLNHRLVIVSACELLNPLPCALPGRWAALASAGRLRASFWMRFLRPLSSLAEVRVFMPGCLSITDMDHDQILQVGHSVYHSSWVATTIAITDALSSYGSGFDSYQTKLTGGGSRDKVKPNNVHGCWDRLNAAKWVHFTRSILSDTWPSRPCSTGLERGNRKPYRRFQSP